MVHLRAMVRRQTGAGPILMALLCVILVGPEAIDWARGKPWLNSTIAIVTTSTGEQIIEDVVIALGETRGERDNYVETEDGRIVCVSSHLHTWQGEKKKNWSFPAFVNCTPPNAPYRVCSNFSVKSPSGLRRDFGPFCSPIFYPETDQELTNGQL